MEEPDSPSFFSRFSRLVGGLTPPGGFRVSPAFAGAAVAVVAVAVVATVWAVSGNGGPEFLRRDGVSPAHRGARQHRPAYRPGRGPGHGHRGSWWLSDSRPGSNGGQCVLCFRSDIHTAAYSGPSADYCTGDGRGSRVRRADGGCANAGSIRHAGSCGTGHDGTGTGIGGRPVSQGHNCPRVGAGHRSGWPSGTRWRRSPTARHYLRDYQRQPFVSTSEDNVSTFSLDTDRTSFQLALNWARAGYEVHPDSVRAEEWLNAFNYEYDPPASDSNFAVTSDLFPHPLDEDKYLARITFQAPELVVDRPLNVTLVLDASGSMADGNRVDIARQAAESIRQSLRPSDRIGVVHFTQEVIDQYTVEHTHPGDDRVVSSVAWLQPHGSTNVQAGLNLGVQLAAQVRDQRPEAYNYVILMSDGMANVDATDPFAILETAYDPDTSDPLRLITIGVGINNYNDPLLEQLAQHGNGWYRYLDSPEQAQATFTRDNWLALSTPFADQTRAQVTWDAVAVDRWRIIGYENRVTADENFTQDRKEFAEIYSGAATTVLYELELTESAREMGSIQMGTTELRWVDPASGGARSQTILLSGDAASDYDGRDGSLAHFGAIVALTADLYAGLPGLGSEAPEDVFIGLIKLAEDLTALEGELGRLDSYKDFRLVLDRLVESVEQRLPPSVRSGYSR